MQYKVSTNVSPYYPVKLPIPMTSICYSLISLLGEWKEKKFHIDKSIPGYLNMTLGQIFKQTPSSLDTLISCKYRDLNRNILIEVNNGTECTKLFKVVKYKMQGYICYKYEWHQSDQYSYHALVNSLYEPREIYHLNINDPLNDQYLFYPIMHLNDLPVDDRLFDQQGYKLSNAMYHLTFDLYESQSLKFPYETNCAETTKLTCYLNCVDNKFKSDGLIHDSSPVIENTSKDNLKPALIGSSPENVKKRSYCHNCCQYDACNYDLVTTYISPAYPSDEKMNIVIETVDKPITKILYVSALDLNDYLTQMASLIGIYIGFSFVALRKPFHFDENINLHSLHHKIKLYSSVVSRILASNVKIFPTYVKKDEPSRLELTKHLYILGDLLKLVIFALFLWQIIIVCQNYFSYPTEINFKLTINFPIIIPTLTLCLPLEDLFGIKELKEVNEFNFNEKFLQRDTLLNFTLKQFFEKTVTEEIIGDCLLRDWTENYKRFTRFDQSKCLKFFNITKLFYNQKTCLMIVPSQPKKKRYQTEVRFSPKSPGLIYGIIGFEKYFEDELYILTHLSNKISSNSIEYIVTARKRKSKNMILISNREYDMELLEPPYDTFCNKKSGSNSCFQKCQAKLLSKFERVSYVSTETRDLPYEILSYTDLLDEKMNEEWKKIESHCKKICWQQPCDYILSLTYLDDQIMMENLNESEIMFALNLPSYPKCEITAVASYSFYDLVYQIFCCCSFWLGFSILDLNPFAILVEKKKEKAQKFLIEKFIALAWLVGKLSSSFNSNSFYKKPKRRLRELLIDYIIYSLAIVAFTSHSIYSMKIYLIYPSNINIYVSLDQGTDLDMYLCLDTAELLARKMNLNQKFDGLEEKAVLLNATIASLFDETPRGDEIIEQCAHWGIDARQGKVKNMSLISDRVLFECKNTTLCREIFAVRKFIFQNFMCYGIRPRNYTYWDRIQMKNTLHHQKTSFEVSVNNSLLTNRYSVVAGRSNLVPFTSSNFSPNIIKDLNYSIYDISYLILNQSVLPSPYAHDGFIPFMFDRCLNTCVNDKMLKYNLTLSRRFKDSSNVSFITYIHQKVDLVSKHINDVLDKCETGCAVYNKHISSDAKNFLYIAVATFKPLKERTSDEPNLTSFRMRSTNTPVLKIIFRLKISLVDQIINIGSIISIWFGFSMMHLTRIRDPNNRFTCRNDILLLEEKIISLKRIHNIRYQQYQFDKKKIY